MGLDLLQMLHLIFSDLSCIAIKKIIFLFLYNLDNQQQSCYVSGLVLQQQTPECLGSGYGAACQRSEAGGSLITGTPGLHSEISFFP